MTSKLGKTILYLNAFAVFFVGILDDIHIDVIFIYRNLLSLELLLLIPLILMDRKRDRLRRCLPVLCAIVLWLAYMLGTSLANGVPFAGVWDAVHSFCSTMILFLGTVVFWDLTDFKYAYKLLKVWYVLNLALSVVEFIFFEKRNDMLGGLIGCRMGSNHYMNLIHCALLIAALAESFYENRLKPYTVFTIFATVFLASLQELKVFYIEFPLILLAAAVIYVAQRRVGWKVLGLTLLLAALSVGVGLAVMYFVYPNHYAVLVGEKTYADYELHTRSPYAISRSHFISEIDALWFHGDIKRILFGIGFGGGHPGTSFYEANEPMHYLYFTSQTLFLEGGLIGLGLFTLVFLVSALQSGWNFLSRKAMSVIQTFGAVFSLIMVLNIFYINALQNYTAMLIWPLMAVPFIGNKSGE